MSWYTNCAKSTMNVHDVLIISYNADVFFSTSTIKKTSFTPIPFLNTVIHIYQYINV